MKARLLVTPLAVAITLSGTVYASSMVSQPGPLLTQGASPTSSTGFSTLYNPAAGELVISKDDTVRWGYISSFGTQLEIGQFDNFDTEIDDLIDELDQEDLSLNDAQDIIDSYDAIRTPLAEEGYFKSSTHLAIPITPLSLRLDSIKGVLTFNSRVGLDLKGSFLDDSISFEDLDGDGSGELLSNTSLYVKGAETLHFGVSYSRELKLKEVPMFASVLENTPGSFFGGVSLNYYSISLSKQVISLTSQDDDDEVSDIISDSYEDNQTTTSNVGLDLGIIWEAENFGAGFVWRNINEPEFDYGSVGINCDAGDVNCNTAAFFSNRIDLTETYVMNSQMALSGSLRTENKAWELLTSLDLNEVLDPVGDEYQWFSLSGNYSPASWSRFRLGYSKNLAGSELSTINAGLSLGVLNLDVRYGLDSVTFDDSDVPRTVGINIGLESQF